MSKEFVDRKTAGEKLGEILKGIYKEQKVSVFALPRGGVILGEEIARFLNTPLRVVLSRKIGHPLEPEYALAAISEHHHLVSLAEEIHRIDPVWFARQIAREEKEIERRRMLYDGKQEKSLKGKIAILVDDGVATGLTLRAAILDILDLSPKKVCIAVPIIPDDIAAVLKKEGYALIALHIPKIFSGSIGSYYQSFPQITDSEVTNILQKHVTSVTEIK